MVKLNYIHHRDGDRLYYFPDYFHNAPTANQVVPLLNIDVNSIKSIMSIYGSSGFEKYQEGYLMLSNFPIKDVKIGGKIVGETYKDFDPAGRINPKNYVLLEIDDFSGTNLTVIVKVREAAYLASGLQFGESYGKYITAIGQVADIQRRKTLVASDFDVIFHADFGTEVEWWNQAFMYRLQILLEPWTLTRSYIQVTRSVVIEDTEDVASSEVITINSDDADSVEIGIELPTTQRSRFQFSFAIISYLLHRGCKNLKLDDMIEDEELLQDLSDASQHEVEQYVKDAVDELCQYGLLVIERAKNVLSRSLLQLAVDTKLRLQILKLTEQPFSLKTFLAIKGQQSKPCIDHKLLNGIITWLLDYDFCEIGDWNYDVKEMSWRYAGRLPAESYLGDIR